jgi:hypothetical protein
MSTPQTLAALETQAFSLMGRLHVTLRRQTGRVTDIEYMRIDPAYCRHVLDMAGQTANIDVLEICGKLEEVYFGPEGLFVRAPPKLPLLARITSSPAPAPVAPAPQAAPAAPAAAVEQDHGALVDQGYVGRLR